LPATFELQETAAVPDAVTLLGFMLLQLRPVGILSSRLTTPLKLFTEDTVIVDVTETPALTAAGDVAAIVKSMKLNVAVAVCTSEPLVPVNVST
jgi:hypothetical protein